MFGLKKANSELKKAKMARFEEAEIRNLKMKICMKCNARNPIKATRCRKCNSKALRMKNKETKGK